MVGPSDFQVPTWLRSHAKTLPQDIDRSAQARSFFMRTKACVVPRRTAEGGLDEPASAMLEHHHMVDEVATVLLHKHHLGHEITALKGEALLPNQRD